MEYRASCGVLTPRHGEKWLKFRPRASSQQSEYNQTVFLFRYIKMFQVIGRWYLDSILKYLNPSLDLPLTALLDRLALKTEKWIATRGHVEAIMMLKRIRVCLYRYLAGDPLFVTGLSQYKDGLPKILGPEVADRIRKGEVAIIRATLSFLQISRIIPGWKKLDLSPIYLPPREEFSALQEEFKFFLVKSKSLPRAQSWAWDYLHPTTRMGPNGPALNNATFDFKPWIQRYGYILSLLPGFYHKLIIYLQDIAQYFDSWPVNPKQQFKDNPILRRLSTVDDKEAKERVIGIVDYWSQSLLKPFHESILRILGGWKTDLTSGQNISPFGDSSQKYWSIDLTSATDRFPISLQKLVVERLHGVDFSNAWEDLMIGTPFEYRGKYYKYATGQPMGAYSSWAVFALTHHLWVQFSAKRVGKQLPFLDYRLLGDDIVIRDDSVAQEYLSLLKQIGVDVSEDKTLVSPDSFEFAKRFFFKGEEVTGFPLAGIQNTAKGVTETLMVLSESLRRGYPDPFSNNPDVLLELFRALRKGSIKGFITWDNDFHQRLNIKGMAFWCYLTRFQNVSLLRHVVDSKLGYQFNHDMEDDQFVELVGMFLARGVIQNQTELIFRNEGMMQEIATGLPEDMKEYHKLMMPVMIVLQEEYMKLVSNVSVLESNLLEEDWREVLFRSWIELDVNPTQILASERRVQAKRAQSRAISLGFRYLKDECPPSDSLGKNSFEMYKALDVLSRDGDMMAYSLSRLDD